MRGIAGVHIDVGIAEADMELERQLARTADLGRDPEPVTDDGRIAEGGDRFSSLIVGIVTSTPFRMRTAE